MAKTAQIFHMKTEHILIPDRIADQIAVQTITKEILGGALAQLVLLGIVSKDRSAGKTKELGLVKKIRDPLMGGAKLAAVAFVKDKNQPLLLKRGNTGQVFDLGHGIIELLDGGDNQGGVVAQLLNQGGGIIRAIHAVLFKLLNSFMVW